jgi:CheY-like chemotaxis protein
MKTILVVDDNAIFRQIIDVSLRQRGHATVSAVNGREALDMLERQLPDLMVLDVSMPVMDGVALLRIIRADARMKSLPVILMTAMSEQQCQSIAAGVSADAYFVKSRFSLKEMMSSIESLLAPKQEATAA